ncbi:fungal hydrophobin [Cubamyces menziesii]|uniref:Hydrophobin n=1 Tax=Trametes cubensis TaxID=1111947 RepID=A0AAD7X453_9APHY|nr:fungal hydrophobin [Cubamyces menziesii]KAJ8454313.1 hypothetical protein ONZ51_g13099 [Trametes cubensis]
MFSPRIASFTALVLPLFAKATPTVLEARQGSGDGGVVCCDVLLDPTSSSDTVALFQLLGINLGNIAGSIGLGCKPFTVIGVGSGNACLSTPVDCLDNNVGGVISIGCVPITM